MKKSAAVFIMLAVICMASFPVSAELKLSAGLKGGLAIGTMYGKDFVIPPGGQKASRLGMDIGGVFTVGLNERLGVGIEAHYAMKGCKILSSYTTENSITIKYDYIDIPVFLNVVIVPGAVSPYFSIGPQLSLLQSSKVGEMLNGVDLDDQKVDGVASMDLAVVAGLGLGISAGPGRAVIEYRFGLGLLTTDDSGFSPKPEVKNLVPVTLSVGYLFDF
jgi:hypothetical protein